MLIAYQHQTRSGTPHLRVRQSTYSDALKERLKRVGSPARWMPGEAAWSYPLTAAAVIALDVVARQVNETVEWRDGLKQFADQHLKQAEHEHEVRLAIEKIIRDKSPLEGYVTQTVKPNGELALPLRHQQVGFHWSQRVSGLLLSWDPGTGKTRGAADASGGWYRNGLIRPMQATIIDGRPGVEGGVLVVCPKTMMRTWQEEVALWQNANGYLIFGSSNKKMQAAGSPAHFHIVNYEALKYVEHNRYDGLIIDECFVAGTLVWSEQGQIPVEDVHIGTRVWALDVDCGTIELKTVIRLIDKDPEGAILEVVTEHETFLCTEGHKFLTASGYVYAAHLRPGDQIRIVDESAHLQRMRDTVPADGQEREGVQRAVSGRSNPQMAPEGATDGGMQAVRERVQAEDNSGASEDMQQAVFQGIQNQNLCDVSPVPYMREGVYTQEQVQPIYGLLDRLSANPPVSAVSGYESARRPRTDAEEQSDVQARDQETSPDFSDPARPSAEKSRREWAWADTPGNRFGVGFERAGRRLGVGYVREDGRWVQTALLPPGYRASQEEGHRGSGWGIALQRPEQEIGSPQGRMVSFARVESVSVYQPRRGERSQGGSQRGITRVFTLEVEGHHNYLVGERVPHVSSNCHRCSNHTKQTMYVLGLAQRARRKLGLSGTPVSNSLESVFYQMLILDGGRTLGSSRTAFLEKYFNTITVGAGFTKHDPKEDSANAIATAMSESTFFIKKEEVLDLPMKTHTPIYLEMTPDQERYYREIKEEAITYIQDKSVTVEQASARMMKLLQVCQGFALTDSGEGRHFNDAKTNQLIDMLTDTLAHRKVIVWAMFSFEIERLVAGLKHRNIPHIRIDGSVTSQRTRDEAMNRWNTDPSLRVYIRQISMSEGVTLHAKDSEVPCFDSIYLALSYRYVDWKQSQDRIHRIGQKYPCSYSYLLTDSGIDRNVYASLLDKNKTAEMVHQVGKDHYLKLLKAG